MRRLSFSACIVWVVARVVPCLIGLDQEEEFGYVLSLQAHTLSGSLLIAHTHTHTQTALCPVQEAETMPLEMWPPPDPVHPQPWKTIGWDQKCVLKHLMKHGSIDLQAAEEEVRAAALGAQDRSAFLGGVQRRRRTTGRFLVFQEDQEKGKSSCF